MTNLAERLARAIEAGKQPLSPSCDGIEEVCAKMAAQIRGRNFGNIPDDIRRDAVQRFWWSQEIQRFRDAYLLSWSLCFPYCPQGPCILEDLPRLRSVLGRVTDWQGEPKKFRRCYQGLVNSYFTYDAYAESSPITAGSDNWKLLREYLRQHVSHIKEPQSNPYWVETALENQQLFADHPCDPYAESCLRGDASAIDRLRTHLGIAQASWFLRELVLAQITKATQFPDRAFQQLLNHLLSLLSTNQVLRDRGLILILDRYARVEGTPMHQELRNRAVEWWGNPWLPSNNMRWGGVRPETRAMVSDWLKLEFIETFFTKLAEDGFGDQRRLNFWKRYVKAIDHIEFALGAATRNSYDPDFVLLRKKMTGLLCILDAPGMNNAFIMHMGSLVAVEFSGMGNAFYGYANGAVPFDTTQPLQLAVDGYNSLKNSQHIIWLQHQDDIRRYHHWEDRFAAEFLRKFRISPLNSMPHTIPAAATAHARTSETYSLEALDRLSREHNFKIDDNTALGGNLWVRTNARNNDVNARLVRWGFKYLPDKGWWKR